MKIAVLGDIHANLKALESVLKDIDRKSVDRIFHTGDIVGYCTDISGTIKLLKDLDILGVVGNHDLMAIGKLGLDGCVPQGKEAIKWTWGNLNEEDRIYISNLPRTLKIDDLYIFHATVDSVTERIKDVQSALDASIALDNKFPGWRAGIHGHVHRQHIYEYNNGQIDLKLSGEGDFKLNSQNKYIICPGSVGISRDFDSRSSYMILDNGLVSMHRIDYDWKATKSSITKNKLKTDLVLNRKKILLRRLSKNAKSILFSCLKIFKR